MSLLATPLLVLGFGTMGWGLLRMVISDRGSRDVGAMTFTLAGAALLSAVLWWLRAFL